MTKMERLIEIMFQEDMERYNNKQPLMYHTEKDFLAEKKEEEEKKMKSRYNHKYVAFIDGIYINDLCDTDDEKEFFQVCIKYGNKSGFRAYIDDEELTEDRI